MAMPMTPSLQFDLLILFLLFLWNMSVYIFLKKRGTLYFSKKPSFIPISIVHLLLAFFLYFLPQLLIIWTNSHLKLIKILPFSSNTTTASIFLLFLMQLSALFFLFLLILTIKKPILKNIWSAQKLQKHYTKDIVFGIVAWFFTFPCVLFIHRLVVFILKFAYGISDFPDQNIIHIIKIARGFPFSLTLLLILTIIIAPMVEEFLFRGLLLNFFKTYLGRKLGIFLSAIGFSAFHYSSSQKFANLPILISLFFLGAVLGFVYEKRKSLITPIMLHATFNLVSMLNLLLINQPEGL